MGRGYRGLFVSTVLACGAFWLKLNLAMEEAASREQQRGRVQKGCLEPRVPNREPAEFLLRTGKLRKITIILHENFPFLSDFPSFRLSSFFL